MHSCRSGIVSDPQVSEGTDAVFLLERACIEGIFLCISGASFPLSFFLHKLRSLYHPKVGLYPGKKTFPSEQSPLAFSVVLPSVVLSLASQSLHMGQPITSAIRATTHGP